MPAEVCILQGVPAGAGLLDKSGLSCYTKQCCADKKSVKTDSIYIAAWRNVI